MLRRAGCATIYVSDVPRDSKYFAAVQWLSARGGLHGLVPAGKTYGERGPNIEGQYYSSFPGHAFEADREADSKLTERWLTLVSPADAERIRGELAKAGSLTRGEVALRLFATRSKH